MTTEDTIASIGGVYGTTARELLTVTCHMLRWSTTMTVQGRSGIAVQGEERNYRLHRAAVADQFALLTGTEDDVADANITGVELWAIDRPNAGPATEPREYVREAYRAWLANHPLADPLTPGDWW